MRRSDSDHWARRNRVVIGRQGAVPSGDTIVSAPTVEAVADVAVLTGFVSVTVSVDSVDAVAGVGSVVVSGGGIIPPPPTPPPLLVPVLPFLGPVPVRLQNPEFAWVTSPDSGGTGECSISGVIRWTSAQQIGELVNNPGRSVTIGAHSGVLEYLYFTDDLLGPMSGWYLLGSFHLAAAQQWSAHGLDYPVAFSLEATYLGDNREPVVVRSARQRANDFAVSAVAVASDPFWTVGGTDTSMSFLTGISSVLYREYDATAWSTTPMAANKVCYLSTLGSTASWLTVVPAPRAIDDDIPGWIAFRGGDARAYDESEGREVFGPSHPFKSTADLTLGNGLLRASVGDRGAAPSIALSVFWGGQWYAAGTLVLDGILMGARLIRCSPDAVTLALSIAAYGEALVTLRRGERMLRFVLGPERPPLVSSTRTISWVGASAPASSGGRRVESTANAQGFSRMLMATRSYTDAPGFGITSPSTARFEVGAALSRADVGETPAAQHAQFCAAVQQETRVR